MYAVSPHPLRIPGFRSYSGFPDDCVQLIVKVSQTPLQESMFSSHQLHGLSLGALARSPAQLCERWLLQIRSVL